MNKVVWITVLDKKNDEAAAKQLFQTVTTYGLSGAGHFWQDNLFKMSWAEARDDLVKKETALWIIVGSADTLAKEDIRYGLSMLALSVLAQKGQGFPILLVTTGGQLPADTLPTPLKGADVLALTTPGLGPKIVAKANLPIKNPSLEYRVDVYGLEGIGQWFEVGPAAGHTWNGVMFGVSSGEINAHGVGPAGHLPERSVVEYPMKGLKLQLGEVEYTAWAVQNQLQPGTSYFLRIKDYPARILFGPLSEGEDAEVFIINLK